MDKDISKRIFTLKDNVVIIPFRDEGLQIIAYGREFIFKGRVATILIPNVLKHLDGKNSVAQVCDKVIADLGPHVESSVIVQTIKTLDQHSLLREVSTVASLSATEIARFREQLDFFAAFENNGEIYQKKLLDSHLGLFIIGDMAEAITHAIKSLGIGKTTLFTLPSPIAVNIPKESEQVALNSLEFTHLESLTLERKITHIMGISSAVTCQLWDNLNKISLTRQLPWLRVEVSPLRAEIGPGILPGRTACYRCFDLRRQSLKINYDEYKNLENFLKNKPALKPFIAHSLLRDMACSLAASEIMRIISGYFYPQSYNGVLMLDFFNTELSRSPLLKLPRCPACSPVNTKPMKEVYPKVLGGTVG